jgi:hypothetical protein
VRFICHSFLNICTIMFLVILAATIATAQKATPQKISPQAGACATGPCVSTYHNDPMRDGVNSNETTLKPSLFPSQTGANFGLLVPAAGGATGAVDSLIYAQPLYLSRVAMAAGCAGTQNIILVATENNSVYAFTWTYTLTSTGYSFALTQCWMLNLNQAGEYAIPFTALSFAYKGVPCNTQVPQTGITGTPVVDTSVTPPVMYVVTAHQTANLTYTYRLHAININSGTEIVNGSAAPYNLSGVFPNGLAANQVNQRPGLAMFTPAAGGTANLYVAFGSFCDIAPYSGYLAALTYNYSTSSFSPIGTNWVFDTESGADNQGGGIWMGGAAPAVDSSGNVYVAVANGDWNGTTQFGESVVQIATTTTGLAPVDYYTPNDYAELNNDLLAAILCSSYGPNSCPKDNLLTLPAASSDYDLGSGGVTLLSPAGITSPVCAPNAELVTGGKEGVIYGVCYNPQAASTLQKAMGGLDGCGYNCTNNSNPSLSACTQSSTPGNGSIAQCFQGVNAGEAQPNGSDTIFTPSGIRGNQAFWAGTSKSPENYLYVAGATAAMEAYQANPATGAFAITGAPERAPKTFAFPGPIPAVSWDGSHPSTALLWAIDSSGFGMWHPLTQESQAAKPANLIVYNAIPGPASAPILRELWTSALATTNTGPGAVKFTVPTIAGGLVFVAGGTPGYAPGPPGATGVNCTAAALVTSTTQTVCGGMLSVYGRIHD